MVHLNRRTFRTNSAAGRAWSPSLLAIVISLRMRSSVEIAANGTLACPPWRRLKAVEFQCRSCSKPGPVAAFATFEVAGKSFGDSLLHGLLVVEGIYCGRSWRSKYHFVSERREARFRFEEIAAREEKVDTSPARVSGEKPDRFARRVGRPHRTRDPKITHSLGV